MEVFAQKTPWGFVVNDDEDREAIKHIKTGDMVRVDIKRVRNARFHRKFFAMLKIGFDAWEPPEKEHRGLPVQKNFDRFRKDCIVAAGFYEPVVTLSGEVRADANSIAFGNMSESEFESVYSAVANVILQRVLRNYSRDDLDNVVNQMMGFV